MKTPKRPVALMTLAQVICALAVSITACLSLIPSIMLGYYVQQVDDLMLHDNTLCVVLCSGIICLRDLLIGACLVGAEIGAIRLCGRMKKSSTFSEANVKGLGRIALALAIAGGIALLFGNNIVPFLPAGLPNISPLVMPLLLPFLLLTVALMIRTVQLLMRRALDMQDENELTV